MIELKHDELVFQFPEVHEDAALSHSPGYPLECGCHQSAFASRAEAWDASDPPSAAISHAHRR